MSSAQELSNMGKEKIGINLLKMDSQKMLDSYKKLTQEKNLELTRLESFNEKNLQDLNSNSQKLIELSVRGSIKKNTSLSSQEITKISRQITLEIFNDEPQLFNLVTFEDQETLIQNSLNLILDPLASLSK
jgi:hypothetical protein